LSIDCARQSHRVERSTTRVVAPDRRTARRSGKRDEKKKVGKVSTLPGKEGKGHTNLPRESDSAEELWRKAWRRKRRDTTKCNSKPAARERKKRPGRYSEGGSKWMPMEGNRSAEIGESSYKKTESIIEAPRVGSTPPLSNKIDVKRGTGESLAT